MPGACGDTPVWGTDYPLSDLYDKNLLLPAEFAHAVTDVHPCERWAETLNAPVLVVKNVQQARRLILEALNLRGGTVSVDANGSVDVVNAVKRHGAKIEFRAVEQAFGGDEARGVGWGVDSARFFLHDSCCGRLQRLAADGESFPFCRCNIVWLAPFC